MNGTNVCEWQKLLKHRKAWNNNAEYKAEQFKKN